MNPVALVRDGVIWVEELLLAMAIWCLGFGWPLNGLGSWFGDLAYGASNIAGYLSDVAERYDSVVSNFSIIFTWEFWVNLWQNWYANLVEIWDWFVDRWDWFEALIGSWWEEFRTLIEGWIAVAVEGLSDLRAAWGDFWSNIFPTLLDWLNLDNWWLAKLFQIDDLIRGYFVKWFPFYNELSAIWADIKELFDDPLAWLLGKIEAMLVRYW